MYFKKANLLWETEIYSEIIYQKINENFYCFPALVYSNHKKLFIYKYKQ